VLADKDALYNADGNTNITSTRNVLGQTIPFAGEYGISKNPESFASYGFRMYYTDKARGAVIRLSRDGITPVSSKGLDYYLAQELKSATQPLIGSYDEVNGTYNIRLGNKQLSFDEKVDGWVSRLTYAPEFAISLNNEYYTFKSSELYQHSNVNRGEFYGTQEDTTVTTNFNDAPSSIKNFKTLSYEGDAGWTASIQTANQFGLVDYWKNKEGIYTGWIRGNNTTLDTKNFSVQGISKMSAAVASANPVTIPFDNPINVSVQKGDAIHFQRGTTVTEIGAVASVAADRLSMSVANAGSVALQINDFIFAAKPTKINTSGLTGYYSTVTMTNTNAAKNELFAVNSEVFISSE